MTRSIEAVQLTAGLCDFMPETFMNFRFIRGERAQASVSCHYEPFATRSIIALQQQLFIGPPAGMDLKHVTSNRPVFGPPISGKIQLVQVSERRRSRKHDFKTKHASSTVALTCNRNGKSTFVEKYLGNKSTLEISDPQ